MTPVGLTATEEQVAGIWRLVFRIDRVDPTDNFFALGGHSLTAMDIVSHVSDAFDLELSLDTLFDNPTVRRLAQAIDAAVAERDSRDGR